MNKLIIDNYMVLRTVCGEILARGRRIYQALAVVRFFVRHRMNFYDPLGNGQKVREGVEYNFRKSKIFSVALVLRYFL